MHKLGAWKYRRTTLPNTVLEDERFNYTVTTMTRRTWLHGAGLMALPQVVAARPAGTGVIDGLSVYTAQVGPRSWVLMELRTKQGLTGLGDASANETVPTRGAAVAREAFEIMRGRSPFEIERLRNAALFKVAAADPREKRITAASCSALEQCLWDLQGKTLGVPCYQLFGGKLRGTIRNYANINRATRGEQRTPEGFAANAARGVAAGFDAFKLAPFDHMARNESDPDAYEEGVRRGVGFVSAVRRSIGPNRDLLIDGHSRFDAQQAIDVAGRLKQYRLYWMEEMCRSAENLAQFNQETDVPTAGGESLWSTSEFFQYIQSGAVDTVMPDVKYCGGMYELKKIAAIAEAAGLGVAPHGPASPVGNMAAAHVCATLPNFEILELAFGEVPWRAETVVPAEEVRGGLLAVPDRPGIGYEMNPERWQRYTA